MCSVLVIYALLAANLLLSLKGDASTLSLPGVDIVPTLTYSAPVAESTLESTFERPGNTLPDWTAAPEVNDLEAHLLPIALLAGFVAVSVLLQWCFSDFLFPELGTGILRRENEFEPESASEKPSSTQQPQNSLSTAPESPLEVSGDASTTTSCSSSPARDSEPLGLAIDLQPLSPAPLSPILHSETANSTTTPPPTPVREPCKAAENHVLPPSLPASPPLSGTADPPLEPHDAEDDTSATYTPAREKSKTRRGKRGSRDSEAAKASKSARNARRKERKAAEKANTELIEEEE